CVPAPLPRGQGRPGDQTAPPQVVRDSGTTDFPDLPPPRDVPQPDAPPDVPPPDVPPDIPPDVEPTLLCAPFESECASNRTIRTCAADGQSYSREDCAL